MKSIKLLHIGDVHYPNSILEEPAVDLKDEGFNKEFVSKIAPTPFYQVGQSIAESLERLDIDAVLFSGDLTTSGNVSAYEKCVKYFDEIIRNIELSKNKTISVNVVPGNHDLQRKGDGISKMADRFALFKSAWTSVNRDILAVETVRESVILNQDVSLKILSLNTCIGCGEEYLRFPEEIAKTYRKLLEESDLEKKESFDIFCENLDTPAIHADHISELSDHITNCDGNSMCLILGHHPLLPQATVRIAIYTELLNGGNARMALTTLKRPILYCHGHIHADPIEIVSQPGSDGAQLILISAPEYKDGYNFVEVFYTDQGCPIGVEITPYRRASWGGVRSEPTIRLPIALHKLSACDQNAFRVYLNIKEDCRFIELKNHLATTDVLLDDLQLEEILRELQWLGLISVANIKSKTHIWNIARVGF